MTACQDSSDIKIENYTESFYDSVRRLAEECGVEGFTDQIAGYSQIKKVALLGGAPVGYIAFLFLFDQGDICTVCVHEKYRRMKIASRLLEDVLNIGKSQGVKTFHIEVRSGNAPAIALYGKHGFKVTGSIKNYYRNPTEDALLMEKDENTCV